MYIATIPNRNLPPLILLREGYREDGKVKTRTPANLSKLPPKAIAVLRQVLEGKQMVSVQELLEIVEDGSRVHGAARAVLRIRVIFIPTFQSPVVTNSYRLKLLRSSE